MINYVALAQATQTIPDLSALLYGFAGVVITVLGTASIAMKRMVDSHFKSFDTMRARLTTLEDQENDLIKQVATLETQAVALTERHADQMAALREQTQLTVTSKDQTIAEMQRQIAEFKQSQKGLQEQLDALTKQHAIVVKERDTLSQKVLSLEKVQSEQAQKLTQITEDQQYNAELRLEYERHLRSNGIQTDELDLIRQTVQSRIRHNKENKGD